MRPRAHTANGSVECRKIVLVRVSHGFDDVVDLQPAKQEAKLGHELGATVCDELAGPALLVNKYLKGGGHLVCALRAESLGEDPA